MGKNLQENPLLEKINTLKSRFRGADVTDQSMIEEWEQQAKTALITANLQEHEGIKMIIDKVNEDILRIDEVLNTAKSDVLSVAERDRFIDMKDFYRWFLSFFEVARSQILDISKNVDNELEPQQENVV